MTKEEALKLSRYAELDSTTKALSGRQIVHPYSPEMRPPSRQSSQNLSVMRIPKLIQGQIRLEADLGGSGAFQQSKPK